jgi:hypothetical protein
MQSVPLGFYVELCRVGWQCEDYKIADMFDASTDSFSVHLNCYAWSYGIEYAATTTTTTTPVNLDKLVFESLIKVKITTKMVDHKSRNTN